MRCFNNISFYDLFVIHILLSSFIRAGTIKLHYDGSTVQDAYITSILPNFNSGKRGWGYVTYFSSNDNTERTYFRIPIPSFITPYLASSITLAKFKVYTSVETGPFNISLNEVKSNWEENEICWNSRPEHNPAAEDSITLTGKDVWVEFNITNLVKRWVAWQENNNGFVLKPLSESYPVQDFAQVFTSAYQDNSLHPILEITSPELPDSTIGTAVTSVMEYNSKGNSDFQLLQNYPNPFNPSTTVKFYLPKATHVTLSIYNSLGQEVSKLISQDMNAGVYANEWKASGFASGIYYYRIIAGGFSVTKKLILLK